jgi:hypothetical protein
MKFDFRRQAPSIPMVAMELKSATLIILRLYIFLANNGALYDNGFPGYFTVVSVFCVNCIAQNCGMENKRGDFVSKKGRSHESEKVKSTGLGGRCDDFDLSGCGFGGIFPPEAGTWINPTPSRTGSTTGR